MKNIIKVASLENLPKTRPLIAMDDNKKLFAERTRAVPEGFVDLGLPSGTLWYNKNIGATNGSIAESWYGRYYAWGELEEKSGWDGQGTKIKYNWANYKYANGAYNKLTKYCSKSTHGNEGYTDELTQLVPTDDVATVTNSAWRMPTKDEIQELIAGTSNSWVENYNDIEGLNGRLFTGTNGNTMFIPAAGFRDGSSISGVGSTCNLWSSSLCSGNPISAYLLGFYSFSIGLDGNNRYGGRSVRPVC